jgi:hypothetical protein
MSKDYPTLWEMYNNPYPIPESGAEVGQGLGNVPINTPTPISTPTTTIPASTTEPVTTPSEIMPTPEVSQFEVDNIKLSDNTYIAKSDYESLSSDNQAYVISNGVDALNQKLQSEQETQQATALAQYEVDLAQFEANNIKLNDSTYINKESFSSLSPENQTYLMQNGLYAFNQKQLVDSNNALIASGVPTVQLDNGELVAKSFYDSVPTVINDFTSEYSNPRQLLKTKGTAAYNKWASEYGLALAEETMMKLSPTSYREFQTMSPEARLLFAQKLEGQATQEVTQEFIPTPVTYSESENSIRLDNGDSVDKTVFDSIPTAIDDPNSEYSNPQQVLKTKGIEAYNNYIKEFGLAQAEETVMKIDPSYYREFQALEPDARLSFAEELPTKVYIKQQAGEEGLAHYNELKEKDAVTLIDTGVAGTAAQEYINSLQTTQETDLAEFQQTHVQVGPKENNEWMLKTDFDNLPEDSQTVIKIDGLSGYTNAIKNGDSQAALDWLIRSKLAPEGSVLVGTNEDGTPQYMLPDYQTLNQKFNFTDNKYAENSISISNREAMGDIINGISPTYEYAGKQWSTNLGGGFLNQDEFGTNEAPKYESAFSNIPFNERVYGYGKKNEDGTVNDFHPNLPAGGAKDIPEGYKLVLNIPATYNNLSKGQQDLVASSMVPTYNSIKSGEEFMDMERKMRMEQ